tara:strand:- start:1940 stop:2533 length:594 start_codon:yes stop_codon:yes gene_type:complete
MKIKSLYDRYFQKSKVFLYPLLGIKRGNSVVPIETYISWDGHYSSEDMKLICVYKIRSDAEYKKFEKNILTKHTRLYDYSNNNDVTIFIFDFSDLNEDWDYFINGKYSKFTSSLKNRILKFFDKHSGNYAYMQSYLSPEKHFEDYSIILDVDIDFLKSVGELCSKPDLEKENLKMELADLDNIAKSIVKQIKNQQHE